MKRVLTNILAGVGLVFMTFLIVAIIIIGMFYVHSFVLDIVANGCYTNMFGEEICKVK